MKIILLSVLAVAMIGVMVPSASAQTIPLTLIFDPIQEGESSGVSGRIVQEGDTITFSGILLTADEQYFIPNEIICKI